MDSLTLTVTSSAHEVLQGILKTSDPPGRHMSFQTSGVLSGNLVQADGGSATSKHHTGKLWFIEATLGTIGLTTP